MGRHTHDDLRLVLAFRMIPVYSKQYAPTIHTSACQDRRVETLRTRIRIRQGCLSDVNPVAVPRILTIQLPFPATNTQES